MILFVTFLFRQIRNPHPLFLLTVGWLVCVLVMDGWKSGTLFALYLLVFGLAFVFGYPGQIPVGYRTASEQHGPGRIVYWSSWRTKRLAMYRDEDMDPPLLPKLVWHFAVELWRKLVIRGAWVSTCMTLGLVGHDELKRIPRLYKLRGGLDPKLTGYVDAGRVKAFVDDFQAKASGMSQFIKHGVYEVVVTPLEEPGTARVEIMYGDPLSMIKRLRDLVPATLPNHLVYGFRADGRPAMLNYLQSVMIGGLTRRGKSVVCKAMIAYLLWMKVPFALYIADLKDGIELPEFAKQKGNRHGSMVIADYQETKAGALKMLTDMHKVMQQRAVYMKENGILQHIPTEEEPLLIALLDETIPLAGELKADKPIGKIAYMGAGRACVLWLNTQLGEKTIMGEIRDLIPQRIAFGTRNYIQTNMILGDGAHQSGALCHKLGDKKGIGYSGGDGDHAFERFRAINVTREEALAMAESGTLPPIGAAAARPNRHGDRRHVLYRAFDDSAEFFAFYKTNRVYNGRTSGFGPTLEVACKRRFDAHRAKDWKFCAMHGRFENYWRVHAKRIELVELATFEQLGKQEKLSIETEYPVFNDKHNRKRGAVRWVKAHTRHAVQPAQPSRGSLPAAKPARRSPAATAPPRTLSDAERHDMMIGVGPGAE